MSAPMILIRGLPGSGKSTFGKALCNSHDFARSRLFETDNFFIDSISGIYKFNSKLLGNAHVWNQGEVIRFCRDFPTWSCVIANTFTTKRELDDYIRIARSFNRKFIIVELATKHDNVHGVSDATLERMVARWEDVSNYVKFMLHVSNDDFMKKIEELQFMLNNNMVNT